MTVRRLVIASGKGGTGKTTLAVAMALAVARAGAGPVVLADYDVEQPNCAIQLEAHVESERPAEIRVPVFGGDQCDYCGGCARACKFGALAVAKGRIIHHEHLCHGCGACWISCAKGSIAAGKRTIGRVLAGTAAVEPGLRLVWGELTTGEPLAVPVIQATSAAATAAGRPTVIIDGPPGTACGLVETLRGANAALMVTEPTPFGEHDLRRALEVAALLKIKCSLVLNREGIGDPGPIESLARRYDAPILMRLPFSRRTAAMLSQGQTLLDVDPTIAERLVRVWSACVGSDAAVSGAEHLAADPGVTM